MEIAADSFNIYQTALDVYIKQALLRQLSTVMKLAREDELLYKKALLIYTSQVAPSQLASVIGANVGAMRRKYTKDDRTVIGFEVMQFHYTSQMLLELLSPVERLVVGAYFKLIDDRMYMPLQRAYAAAKHDYDSHALSAVQQILPATTQIAKNVFQKIVKIYPNYRSYTDLLSDSVVKTSSIRDAEMFQVYLWVCALEKDISKGSTRIISIVCHALSHIKSAVGTYSLFFCTCIGQEIRSSLTPKLADTLMPYFQVMWQMFSPEVFGELDLDRKLDNVDDEFWQASFS